MNLFIHIKYILYSLSLIVTFFLLVITPYPTFSLRAMHDGVCCVVPYFSWKCVCSVSSLIQYVQTALYSVGRVCCLRTNPEMAVCLFTVFRLSYATWLLVAYVSFISSLQKSEQYWAFIQLPATKCTFPFQNNFKAFSSLVKIYSSSHAKWKPIYWFNLILTNMLSKASWGAEDRLILSSSPNTQQRFMWTVKKTVET